MFAVDTFAWEKPEAAANKARRDSSIEAVISPKCGYTSHAPGVYNGAIVAAVALRFPKNTVRC
jgi:hypothetical protein